MSQNELDILPIEDAFEDSPQVRLLQSVFEADVHKIRNYTTAFHKCCADVLRAERDMASATKQLASHLRSYLDQDFLLAGHMASGFVNQLHEFAGYADEVSLWHQSLSEQLSASVLHPLDNFLHRELRAAAERDAACKIAQSEVERTCSRYAKLSQKKDTAETWGEAGEALYRAKKNYHHTTIRHYRRLTTLQLTRKLALLEPLLGYFQALRTLMTNGHKTLCAEKEASEFATQLHQQVQNARDEYKHLDADLAKTQELVCEVCEPLYHPEVHVAVSHIPEKKSSSPTQKSGYLFVRTRYMGVVSNWERCYCYTQHGNLMSFSSSSNKTPGEITSGPSPLCAPKAVAGTVLAELGPATAIHATESDDRPFVFGVTTGKKSVILQALSETERDDWIVALLQVARDSGYVTGSGEAPQVKPSRSMSLLTEMGQFIADRFRSPTTPSAEHVPHDVRLDLPLSSGVTLDIVYHSPTVSSTSEQEETNSERVNPFNEEGQPGGSWASVSIRGSSYCEAFLVRFVGAVPVRLDRGEEVVQDACQTIGSARASHPTHLPEVLLILTEQSANLTSPALPSKCRASHPLSRVTYWSTHGSSFGYVVREGEEDALPKLVCVVLEPCSPSTAEGLASSFASASLVGRQMARRQREKDILLANIDALEDKTPEDHSPAEETPPLEPASDA